MRRAGATADSPPSRNPWPSRRGAGGEVLDVTPTKLLIGQILIVFAIVALGLWAATEWAASMLAYQRELGPSWFSLGELPVYRPWALFPWW